MKQKTPTSLHFAWAAIAAFASAFVACDEDDADRRTVWECECDAAVTYESGGPVESQTSHQLCQNWATSQRSTERSAEWACIGEQRNAIEAECECMCTDTRRLCEASGITVEDFL